MNYEEAYRKLEYYGQLHLLQHYGRLSEGERQGLLAQIERLDFEVLRQGEDGKAVERAITPIRAMQRQEIARREAEFRRLGLTALREGKVGAVLLAGGMGTRLGSDSPKGMYDIGITHPVYIFQRLIENLTEVVKEVGRFIPLFVMTSERNHGETVTFFEEHGYFGYDADEVEFFMQEMAPATDYEGRVYLEGEGRIASSPNGNGGWFASMERSGILGLIRTRGIEWLNVFAVDNVLQRIADPAFIGAVLAEGAASGAKVIRKNARDEKVGVMCKNHGHPSIVEYYDLTEEMMDAVDAGGEPAYQFGVILNYLFRVADLEEILDRNLPLHRVEKKITYWDDAAGLVKPLRPNGYKYETLVLDMIELLSDCLPYEVVREREFAPIKNLTGVDSVESARKLLGQNGIAL